MKNQALFSSKDKTKKLNCRLLQFLFGALRVKLKTTRQSTTVWNRQYNKPKISFNFFQDAFQIHVFMLNQFYRYDRVIHG